MPEPTSRQRRLLLLLHHGAQLWEELDRPFCTIYDEPQGRDLRVRRSEIEQMVEAGWIERVDNSAIHRMDYWQLTEAGRLTAERWVRPPRPPSRTQSTEAGED